MDIVFILWHNHQVNGRDDLKFIGVYKTREEAEAAIARVNRKPGFRDSPDGFEINEHVLGRDGWTEGYISEAEAMRKSD